VRARDPAREHSKKLKVVARWGPQSRAALGGLFAFMRIVLFKLDLPLEPKRKINQVFSRLWPVATDNTKALVSSRGSRLFAGALKLANEDDSNEMKDRELRQANMRKATSRKVALSNSRCVTSTAAHLQVTKWILSYFWP
jgi:hypothetical protein